MHQDHIVDAEEMHRFAQMGNGAVTYMREITSEEVYEKFPHVENVQPGMNFWAMFAANGSLVMLADSEMDLTQSAFYNDLKAVKLN